MPDMVFLTWGWVYGGLAGVTPMDVLEVSPAAVSVAPSGSKEEGWANGCSGLGDGCFCSGCVASSDCGGELSTSPGVGCICVCVCGCACEN